MSSSLKSFASADVLKIVGLSKSQITDLMRQDGKYRYRLYEPEFPAMGSGNRASHSFKNLIQLASAKALLDGGFKREWIGRVLKQVSGFDILVHSIKREKNKKLSNKVTKKAPIYDPTFEALKKNAPQYRVHIRWAANLYIEFSCEYVERGADPLFHSSFEFLSEYGRKKFKPLFEKDAWEAEQILSHSSDCKLILELNTVHSRLCSRISELKIG